MKDSLHIAWEETLRATDIELGMALLEGLHDRQNGKSGHHERMRVTAGANPVVLSTKGNGKKGYGWQWTSKGSRSRGATCAFKHGQNKGKAKHLNDKDRRVRQTVDSILQNQK